MLSWTGEALRLRPYAPAAVAEHAYALAAAGRGDDAKALASQLLKRRPDSTFARMLAAEMERL
jgi:hypothetical protein